MYVSALYPNVLPIREKYLNIECPYFFEKLMYSRKFWEGSLILHIQGTHNNDLHYYEIKQSFF